MNPATQALMRQIEDEQLAAFVEAWDALEALAVAVYRGGQADAAQAAEFAHIQAALRERYPAWQPALEPHWQATKINGAPVASDPFGALIELPAAEALLGNWDAMQTLPAAREALNSLLVQKIETEE